MSKKMSFKRKAFAEFFMYWKKKKKKLCKKILIYKANETL